MDEFSPGPMLDATIARLLWRAIVLVDVTQNVGHVVDEKRVRVALPPFSTRVDASRKVAQVMRKLGYTDCVRCDPKTGRYFACFVANDEAADHIFSEADTKPMAICLAALAAVNGENVDLQSA